MLMLSTTSRVLTTLLGQFNVFDRVDVDWSDYDQRASTTSSSSTALSTIYTDMEYHNSFIRVTTHRGRKRNGETIEDGQHEVIAAVHDPQESITADAAGNLPLLASTERLLRMLQEPLPSCFLQGNGEHQQEQQELESTDLAAVVDSSDDKVPDDTEPPSAERQSVDDAEHGVETLIDARGENTVVEDSADNAIENDKGDGDNDDNAEDDGDAILPSSDDPKYATFQKLARAQNLGDAIFKALSDIYNLKRPTNDVVNNGGTVSGADGNPKETSAKAGRNRGSKDGTKAKQPKSAQPRQKSRNKSREAALEHQRDRLQQQIQQRDRLQQRLETPDNQDAMSSSSPLSPQNGDTVMATQPGTISEIEDDGDFFMDTAAQPSTNDVAAEVRWNGQRPGSKEWITMVAALNSLRLLTPLVLDILFHESRNDSNIRIKGVGIKEGAAKRSRGTKCWLFGRLVYDTVTVKQCKALLEQLIDIYASLGIQSRSIPPVFPCLILKNQYEATLDKTMMVLVDGFKSSRLAMKALEIPQASWVNHHPFDAMEDSDQLKLHTATTLLDDRFGLIKGPTSADAAVHAAYLKSIHALHKYLEKLLSRRFPGSRLSLYGSCLSDLSLGKGADVDLSLHVEALSAATKNYEAGQLSVKQYQDEVRKYVLQTSRCLEYRKTEFHSMQPVPRARVPVCKGTYMLAKNPHSSDGSIDFDICFLNDIAVSNSELLRQYSLVDPRVKALMMTVKRWAKQHSISSTQDQCLSSYAWMNLVIFYVQSLGLVPNLQCPISMKKLGITPDPNNNYWHSVNNLDTCSLTWEQASAIWSMPTRLERMSVASLLYGFFHFYAKQFPTFLFCVSIKQGGAASFGIPKTAFRKSSLFWCIEDPFETVDSHCPHDLGLPVSEAGARKIVDCIQSAEAHLRKVLLGILDEDQHEGITDLWPKPVAVTANVAKSNGQQPTKTNDGRQKTAAATRTPNEGTKSQPKKSNAAARAGDSLDSNRRVPTDEGAARGKKDETSAKQPDKKEPHSTAKNANEQSNANVEGDTEPKLNKRDRRRMERAKKFGTGSIETEQGKVDSTPTTNSAMSTSPHAVVTLSETLKRMASQANGNSEASVVANGNQESATRGVEPTLPASNGTTSSTAAVQKKPQQSSTQSKSKGDKRTSAASNSNRTSTLTSSRPAKQAASSMSSSSDTIPSDTSGVSNEPQAAPEASLPTKSSDSSTEASLEPSASGETAAAKERAAKKPPHRNAKQATSSITSSSDSKPSASLQPSNGVSTTSTLPVEQANHPTPDSSTQATLVPNISDGTTEPSTDAKSSPSKSNNRRRPRQYKNAKKQAGGTQPAAAVAS